MRTRRLARAILFLGFLSIAPATAEEDFRKCGTPYPTPDSEPKAPVREIREERAAPVRLVPGVRAAGRIVDEAGRPVVGAEVALSDPLLGPERQGERRTRTSRAGRFRFDNLPEGDVAVWIRHPSYVPRREVHSTEEGDLGRIVLRRGVQLTGRVSDPDGRPVTGLPLQAFLPGMEKDAAPLLSVSTGPDGSFVLPHVPAGALKLSACREDYQLLAVNVDPAGQPVQLTVIPGGTLRGRVLDPEGRPVAGALVRPRLAKIRRWAYMERGQPWRPCPPEPDAITDAGGRFVIGPLPPDLYDLEAHADGLQSTRVRLLRAAARAPIDGIEIRLQRGAPVSADAQGTPGTGAAVPARQPGAGPGATVTGRMLGLAGDEPGPSAWVALFTKERPPVTGALRADGTFRLRGVPAGTWTLSTEVSPHQRAGTTIVVGPGQTEVRADLQLPPARSVSGRLLDDHGRPVAGATILAWRDSRTTSVATRTDGSFHLDLPDGSYLLHVEKPGWRRYGPRDLQVQGSAVADLEIRMENVPGTTLRGRLLHFLPGDRVSLSADEIRPGESWIPGTVELEAYSIPGLHPGLWRIYVASAGCEIQKTIKVLPGITEMEMDLDFTPEAKP